MSKLLLGTAVLGIIGVGIASSASAAQRGSSKSSTPTAPSGANLDELAKKTTDDLLKQDIAAIRKDVEAWKQASDPETAGALSFTLEQAVAREQLVESQLDGASGSPLLRAFGMRVLQLEGRAPRLKLWANAWRTVLPVLAAALDVKSRGITEAAAGSTTATGQTPPNTGAEADPQPDPATMALILAAVKSQDPKQIREVAAKLESLGFPEAAKDLRAMADLIEQGKATASPAQTAPIPAQVPPPVVLKPETTASVPAPAASSAPSSAGLPLPSSSASSTNRIALVHRGEGMSQVAGRVLGSAAEGFKRWKEMRALNPLFKSDAKGNPKLNEGDALNVPPSWVVKPGETILGRSSGPGRQPVIDTSGTVASSSAGQPLPASASPAGPVQRFVVVKKGEGVAQTAMRFRGKAFTDADRKRLRDFNAPPFKKTPDGSGLVQNPGDKLRVPPEWPPSIEEVVGGAGGGRMTVRQLRASRIALAQHFGQDDGERLAQFQQGERIEPTGTYGPATALILCHRFGMVPPVPRVWGRRERENRQQFARNMYVQAKRDPQRADEFRRVARQAEGRIS